MQIKERRSEMGDKITKSPKIRFVGFTDAWEERKFIELLDIREGIRRGPFGSALKKELFVPKSDYVVYEQQNAIYDKWETRYNITKDKFDELRKFVLSEGDFIMSGAGTIGRISRVPNGIKQGVFNQALIRFKINTEVTNSNYFLEWIRSDNMQRKFTEANPGSAMTNLVPMHEVKEWVVSSPSLGEQKKIGDFFTELSYLLTLHQRKLELLKDMKKSLLQKMFPKDGANVPEIRFAGFAGAWEQLTVSELANRYDNLRVPITASERVAGSTPYYGANGIQDYVEGFTHDGEFILVAEDGASDLQNYPVQYVNGKVWVNNHAHVLQAKPEIADNKFLMNALKHTNIEPYLVGGGRAKLNADVMMKISFRVPELAEQKQIGSFFENLDHLTTLHQRELNSLENLKKSLLQQMFI
ncbi:restriction endonuclease subunit S [Bacillus altitudinis]|uniref:restriction endonuclease subunit S n=2 Tax=Bacillus altitudinis TaxID=293387 RepID=UPI002488ACEC|nr:type I restriction enzyme S subunit [Micromonospora sp. 1209]